MELLEGRFPLRRIRRQGGDLLLPDQEAIHLLLGRVYQALGRAADARAEFAEVRRLKAAVIERDSQRVESDALMKPDERINR